MNYISKKNKIRLFTLLGVFFAFNLRKPDTFLKPQFFAEDGAVFFKACFTGNPSFFIPFPDTLQLIPRMYAYFASFASIYYIPLIYNIFCVLTILYIARKVMSDRWQIPYKPLLAILFIIVPHSSEAFSFMANLQWITPILILLQIVQDSPKNRFQEISDLMILILVGLTGPFMLILMPLIIYKLYKKKNNLYDYAYLLISVIISATQIYFILKTHSSYIENAHNDIYSFINATAYRLGGIILFGDNLSEQFSMNFILVAFVLLILFIILGARKFALSNYISIFMTAALLNLFAALFRKGLFHDNVIVNFHQNDRYFYIPRLMVMWSLVLLASHYRRHIKYLALALITIGIANSFLDYPMLKNRDFNWKYYSEIIENNRNSPLVIPINPDCGWFIRLNMKDSEWQPMQINPHKNFWIIKPKDKGALLPIDTMQSSPSNNQKNPESREPKPRIWRDHPQNHEIPKPTVPHKYPLIKALSTPSLSPGRTLTPSAKTNSP